MANVFVNEESLSDIADAIRDKLNVQTTYKPGEMAAAIESISGGSVNNQNKTVHPSSSDQSITADTGYTGLGTVSVKAVTMSNLSAANIVEGVTVKIGDADDDDRIASVTGSASGGITPTGTKEITSNGTNIDVYSYAKADVAVPNSYSAGDEGKVVSNGALVAQGSDTVTTNGTVDTTLISSLLVSVAGGGSTGLEYETGTWQPSADIARGEISFTNQHSKPPFMLMLVDATNDGLTGYPENSFFLFLYMDYWRAFGITVPVSSSGLAYAEAIWKARGTANPSYAGYSFTSANSDDTRDTAPQYSRYWVSTDGFHPGNNSTNRFWKSGRTYKWYAVWKPTT